MHELSYATAMLEAILNSVKKEEEKGKKIKKVSEINLEIGELTFINVEQLKFAFEVIAEGTVCEGAKINVKLIKPMCKCLDCGYEGEAETLDEFDVHCPKCKGLRLKLSGGKEFNIKNATVEYEGE
ncbi:hydrogenase nickel insertion protein HypA [Methanocaldococcus vulcanius M7]|uniref:Hydrogenase maturation factor HypA n=1 Tax=Methanocaldococcus vulcanius (strain ATCC 700851 / DSM 12094 / M7) TaxID=579137 RepID=C9RDS9_METVM|nr:hydrogenase maturation nickel metallochaperone HypA [Methanocaldococcus vulcanius]ACX73458.1 hydrogenase nickel insertion protein HypA [Methanocaldococcus vulcanius M7]